MQEPYQSYCNDALKLHELAFKFASDFFDAAGERHNIAPMNEIGTVLMTLKKSVENFTKYYPAQWSNSETARKHIASSIEHILEVMETLDEIDNKPAYFSQQKVINDKDWIVSVGESLSQRSDEVKRALETESPFRESPKV